MGRLADNSHMRTFGLATLLTLGLLMAGCQPARIDTESNSPVRTSTTSSAKKARLAFVCNNVSDFWTIASKGVNQAAKKLDGFEVEVKMPKNGSTEEQDQILNDLVKEGVQAISISPVDPSGQTSTLNKLADKALLITHDSDAPESSRLCYIGTDNVAAGKMAGEAVLKCLPKGGKIAVFVGKKEAQNAKERFEGLQQAVEGKIEIVGIFTDDTDRQKARQNVTDVLAKYPDIEGLVGLWGYNGPAILDSVEKAGKAGRVSIVCFDEEAETLGGIAKGEIAATVVQQPFEFGYQSVNMMAKLLAGDKSAVPANKRIIVPTKIIDRSSVAEFQATLKELLEG